MWTNSALQPFLDEIGPRLNSISFNNGKYLLIGYESGVNHNDIELTTINGIDLMKVHHKQKQGGRWIEWDDYMTTEFIEGIDVMSEADKDYRIDPYILKG